jgi:hypothetical protein
VGVIEREMRGKRGMEVERTEPIPQGPKHRGSDAGKQGCVGMWRTYGARFVTMFYPALARWANLWRAAGAGGKHIGGLHGGGKSLTPNPSAALRASGVSYRVAVFLRGRQDAGIEILRRRRRSSG